MNTLLFIPTVDDRDGVGTISSRIGLSHRAIAFDFEFDLFKHVRDKVKETPIHCVLVDEAQFLTPKQVLQLTIVCDRLKIPVLCYGIRTDFRGEPFEGSKYLLAWAEEIAEIKTICHSGKKATMNARLDADGNRVTEGEQIDVGHHYLAMSRQEFDLPSATAIEYQIPDQD